MKIAITGGHLTPALAVIQQLKKTFGINVQIIYFGRKYTFENNRTVAVEYNEIPPLGVKYLILTTGRFQRQFNLYTALSLLKIPWGFMQALFYLLKHKPQVIFSFGGYLSVPVVVCGWILGIPVILHEQTTSPGLANKLMSRLAAKICVSWEEAMKYFPAIKTVLTGNPIREEVFINYKSDKQKGQKSEMAMFLDKITDKDRVIYITGGNQGSQIINNTILEILPEILEKNYVIHHCGQLDFPLIEDTKNLLDKKLRQKYFITPWIKTSEYGWVINRADLVISRAGANTIYELLALKKTAILIPISWSAGNEQQKNAEKITEADLGIIIEQKNLTAESLEKAINELLLKIENGKRRQSVFPAITKDAAAKLTEEIKTVLAK